jgi:glucose-6-phosphate 1-epimerase
MMREPVHVVAADGASADVFPYGAHVVSWHDAAGNEGLYLSPRSAFEPGRPIRGGIPVVFPQFADLGSLPKHGFARTVEWTRGADDGAGDVVHFRLADSPATRALWPHTFTAELSISVVGGVLDVAFAVHNPGDAELAFTGALHSYLCVNDIADVTIRGLEDTRFIDKVEGRAERTQSVRELAIAGEIDRVYLDVDHPVIVHDGDRRVLVERWGFPDVVVWNPGPALTATFADLPPDAYRHFVCVEAAAVGSPVCVPPGGTWRGRLRLTRD